MQIWIRRLWLMQKRLFRNQGFLMVILLIPIMTFGLRMISSRDQGLLVVAICDKEKSTESSKVLRLLEDGEHIIRYRYYEKEEEAEQAVRKEEADAAWILASDFTERIHNFSDSSVRRKAPVRIVEKEDMVLLRIARLRLYCGMYGVLADQATEHVLGSYLSQHPDYLSRWMEKRAEWEAAAEPGSIFIHQYYEEEKVTDDENRAEKEYLVTPVRGLLAVFAVLIGCAAGMLYLRDRRSGLTARLELTGPIGAVYLFLAPAVFDGVLGIMIAVKASALFTDAGTETAAALLLFFSSLAFCALFAQLCRHEYAAASAIPVLMILMILQCPVFLQISLLQSLGCLFPPYYYLNAIHDTRMLISGSLYTVILMLISIAAELFRRRRGHSSR